MNEVTAIDVGQYIVDCFRNQNKSITTLKLQKLVYYSQSWSLVWDDAPLFEEDFEAWVNGPVAVSLFHALQGYYYCPADIPNARRNVLNKDQMESIDAVLDYYGNYTSSELVNLTHQEDPWKNAREGILDNAPSHAKITKDKIAEYYSNQCK